MLSKKPQDYLDSSSSNNNFEAHVSCCEFCLGLLPQKVRFTRQNEDKEKGKPDLCILLFFLSFLFFILFFLLNLAGKQLIYKVWQPNYRVVLFYTEACFHIPGDIEP